MKKLLTLIAFSVLLLVPVGVQNAFAVPSVIDPNFKVETVVSGLSLPTTMDFLGPDDILVLQKDDGKVMRVLNGVLQAEPVLDVPVANVTGTTLMKVRFCTDTSCWPSPKAV